MPYMIICQKDDGQIHVNAMPGDAPPEMLADAQPVESLAEAGRMVEAVLGPADPKDAGAEPAAVDGEPAPPGGPPMAPSPMQAGYDNAKRGR